MTLYEEVNSCVKRFHGKDRRFLLSRLLFLLAPGTFDRLLPGNEDRTGYINRGIGSYDDPDDESKSKIVNNTPSKNEEGNNDYQGSQRGKECPAQGFIDAPVDDGFIRLSVILAGVFSNTVEYNDGVI
jgi:hypothetical protein